MIWLVLLFGVVALVFFKMKRSHSYWERKKVPHKKPVPVFGNFLNVSLRKEQLGHALKKFYEEYDENVPYFGVYIFHTPYLVPRSKEMIKQVLIKDFNNFSNRREYTNEKVDSISANVLFTLKNDVWKFVRNKLSPFFTSGKLKMMYPLIKEITDELQDELTNLEGQEIDMNDLSRAYAVDSICSCAFGFNCSSLKHRNNEIKVMINQLLDQKGFIRSFSNFAYFFCPILVDIFRLKFLDGESAAYLVGLFKHSTEQRKRTGEKRHDLIDLLMELQAHEEHSDMFKLDDTRMAAQAIGFLNAGVEGTSTLLSLAFYEMALNPDIQVKVREEISKNLDENGELNLETLWRMEYVDAVIKETLRKYPFIQFLARYAEKDYVFEQTGLKIEKGTKVLIPMLAIHYNPEYYPNPEKFDPERYIEDKMKDLQYLHLAFGEGPRKCIGDRFAMLSMKLGFTMVLKNFEVLPGKNTEIPLKFNKGSIFLTTKDGKLFLKIRKLE